VDLIDILFREVENAGYGFFQLRNGS
jgi:hypothetical protein